MKGERSFKKGKIDLPTYRTDRRTFLEGLKAEQEKELRVYIGWWFPQQKRHRAPDDVTLL